MEEWWALKLDQGPVKPWYWGSSDEHPPALIRELVIAPQAPEPVERCVSFLLFIGK
jgi:hypothetical protein